MGKKIEALRKAANTFADYAFQHMAKDPPQIEKAERNVEMARLCCKAGGFKIARLPKIPKESAMSERNWV